jgi:general secretion pathway protein I
MKTADRNRGFTLIEVLIALTLLSITVTLVIQLFSSSLRSTGSADEYVTAVKRAELRMKELLDADTLDEGSWTETTDEGYQMKIAVSGTLKERTDYLYVKLMRIDLSVLWKNGSKEKVWTLHTLKAIGKSLPSPNTAS